MSVEAFAAAASAASAVSGLAETVRKFREARTQPEIDALHAQLVREAAEAEKRALEARQVASQLHDENLALREEVAQLRAENERPRQFEVDRERYELRALGDDAHVYVPRPGVEPREAPHRLCVRCFEQSKRSILQFAGHEGGLRVLACLECDARIAYPHDRRQRAFRAPGGRNPGAPGLA